MEKKILLSGIQPSGDLTLGNYIGSINQFTKYQDEYNSFIFVADLHAITVDQDPKELRERVRKVVALYIASGLDPAKNTIFVQSENIYHTNLAWILECTARFGELGRMTQFKDKSAKNESFSCGLYTYPVLMASDIIIYDADVVPTGIDQKQHVELARDLADRINKKYGETFKMPEPLIPELGAKIMDLQEPTKKMSKSAANKKGTILILDDLDSVRKKIMSAVTDTETKVYYDAVNKPGISNLLTIYSVLTKKTIKEAEEEFKDSNYGTFKGKVADVVCDYLADIQAKYNEYLSSSLIDEILDNGRDVTMEITKKKYDEVRNKFGIGR